MPFSLKKRKGRLGYYNFIFHHPVRQWILHSWGGRMKRLILIAIVLIALSSALVASPLDNPLGVFAGTQSFSIYGSYLGVTGEEMINSVGAGLQYKAHLFSSPVFYYGDTYVGYPVTRPSLGVSGNSFAIDWSVSMGLGWKFLLPNNRIALAFGAGVSMYMLFDMKTGGVQSDMSFGPEILAEFDYLFSESAFLSVNAMPAFDILQLRLSTEKTVSEFRVRIPVKIGIGLQWGKNI